MAFTEYQLQRLKPGPTRRVLTETGVPPDLRGLQVWVYPSGGKTFVLRYKRGGQSRCITLGSYPAMTLAAAHRQVLAHRAKLKEGIDPVGEREALVRANREAPTVQLLFDDFRDHYLRRHRKRPGDAEAVLENHILSAWAERKAASVTRREIIERIREITEAGTPRVAEVVKGLVGQMFGYAVDVGLLEASPAVRIPIIGSKGARRERTLTDDELRAFWQSLDGAQMEPQTRIALRLLLVTGQRRQEIALARWTEIDRENALWLIPAEHSKNGRAHEVPLSGLALGLLDQLDAVRVEKAEATHRAPSAYLVPSTRVKDQPIDPLAITRAVRRSEEHFGIARFTPHDLRRTCASGLSALGVQRLVVGKVLNHTDDSVTATYDRHDYRDEKRAALDTWAGHLQTVLAEQKPKAPAKSKAASRKARAPR